MTIDVGIGGVLDAIELTPGGPNVSLDRLDMYISTQIPTFE